MNNPVTYHYIELPKFRKAEPDMENTLYQWLIFLDNQNKEMVEMAVKKNKEIQKANEEWEYLTGDEEIKRLEFLELRACLDFNSRLDYETRLAVERELPKAVKKELEKREEEVREKVEEEVREKVEEKVRKKVEEEVREKVTEQVREQGEKNKAIEIAKEMLKAKVPKEEIAKYTKLSKEEINKIESEIKKDNN